MKHRIFLTTALVVMGVSALSAQQPAKSSTTQKTKPVVTQPKVVKTATRPTPSGPKKVELKEAQPGLTKQATVSVDDALKTAMGSGNGTVVSERLEKRGDQIVYRFGIRENGRVRHVMVDAKNNTIVKPQAHTGARRHHKKSSTEKSGS